MTTLADISVTATNPSLLARFTAAVWKAATTIVNEDTGTAQHASRMAWAGRALIVDGKAQSYALSIMRMSFSENATLQAAIDAKAEMGDADIQSAVNGYVPKLAAAGV